MSKTAEARAEKRGAELMQKVTNRHKRAAVAFFDKPLDEFDELDNMVLIAWVADPNRSLEEYDDMPLSALTDVIMTEAE